ncbi:hypothetical protein TREES_T100020554 [Tupaia chinensis]|uniref:Uncharacterized protein n=1 Tax=Tupaia chinensis TaxID=246437 RepID=L9KUN0_TUPCH|nr:hypothetical protein TREES_T100020554 [Tupaia chinensis]
MGAVRQNERLPVKSFAQFPAREGPVMWGSCGIDAVLPSTWRYRSPLLGALLAARACSGSAHGQMEVQGIQPSPSPSAPCQQCGMPSPHTRSSGAGNLAIVHWSLLCAATGARRATSPLARPASPPSGHQRRLKHEQLMTVAQALMVLDSGR